MNKSQKFPLFSLGIFSLPGEDFVLHVFEEKYKSLISDVLADQKKFLVPFVLNGEQQDYGNLVEIVNVETIADNGEMDVKVKAISIVHVGNISIPENNNEYASANFVEIAIRNRKPSERLLTLYTQYLTLRKKDTIESSSYDGIDIFKIALGTEAPSYQKFNLIEGRTTDAFERNLINFLLLQIKIETMTRAMGPKFVLN